MRRAFSLHMQFPRPIKYQRDDRPEFFRDLSARVNTYLNSRREGAYATPAMWGKAAFYLTAYFSVWATLTFASLTRWQGVLLALALGLLGTGIALNIAHDACHSTFAKSRRLNAFLYWVSFNLLGTYGYLWKIGHNETHHPSPNVPGHDVGSDGNGVIRFTSATPWKPMHRYQHIYGPVLYAFYTLTWVLFRDWRVMTEKKVAHLEVRPSRWQYLELAAIKIVYFTYTLVLPLKYSSFSAGEVVVGFLIMHAVLSLYMAAMLFTSHLADEVEFPTPGPDSRVVHSYVHHQLATTQDIHAQSRLANFLLGGFNAHVIHHLFPAVSSAHYPALSKILKETCIEHKMPYLESTYGRALRSHLVFLRKLGQEPLSENRVREAG
jgi:linoleoyl-CoA desaturase